MPAEVLSVRSEIFTARIVWRRLQVPDISPVDDLVRDAQRVARGADDPVPEDRRFHLRRDHGVIDVLAGPLFRCRRTASPGRRRISPAPRSLRVCFDPHYPWPRGSVFMTHVHTISLVAHRAREPGRRLLV